MKEFSIGTKVTINTNYLKKYLQTGEFEDHKDYNAIGIIKEIYHIEGIDFYEILWDDQKLERGFNKELLQEICDPNDLLKELCGQYIK